MNKYVNFYTILDFTCLISLNITIDKINLLMIKTFHEIREKAHVYEQI